MTCSFGSFTPCFVYLSAITDDLGEQHSLYEGDSSMHSVSDSDVYHTASISSPSPKPMKKRKKMKAMTKHSTDMETDDEEDYECYDSMSATLKGDFTV